MKKWLMKLYEKAWRMLPDQCSVCKGYRGGVRGNENIMNNALVCDYCSMEHLPVTNSNKT